MRIDLFRFIYIYIIFGFLIIYFLLIGVKIYKRDSDNYLSKILVCFYHLIATAFIVNLIYASLRDPAFQLLVNHLNILTIFLICFAMGFLLLFGLSLYFPVLMNSKKKISIFLSIYFIACLFLFLIPNGVQVPISNTGKQSFPIWNFAFSSYVFLIFFVSLFLTIIFSIKTYKKFRTPLLAKRMRYFILGTLIMSYFGIAACIFNFLNIYFLRILNLIVSFILLFPGSFFLYIGIGEEIRIQVV